MAGKVVSDVLSKHSYGVSVVKTKGGNNVQEVILVIVDSKGVSRYIPLCLQ